MIYEGMSVRQLTDLVETKVDLGISIYLPTARSGSAVQQGRIRLKNLLTIVEEQLLARGMRHTLALDLLRPAAELYDRNDFWTHRADGLAFFLTKDDFQVHRLPVQVPEFVHLGERFYVRPLLSILNQCRNWYVLALDKNHTQLIHCDDLGAHAVEVENMPESIEEFVSTEHSEKRLQYHSAGPSGRAGSVIAHGAGDRAVEPKERLNRFALAIAHAVEEHLADNNHPVVLAGTEEFQDALRAASSLKNLNPRGITGSPKILDPSSLRSASREIVAEYEVKSKNAALAHYAETAGTGLTSLQVDEILRAALCGRVDILLPVADSHVWGQVSGDRVTVRDYPTVGDEELVNLASILTLENRGTVFDVSPDTFPDKAPMAAVLRY